MYLRVVTWMFVLLLSLGLEGCYKSRIGVIERGDQAPVVGAFDCTYADREGGYEMAMTERHSGKGRYAAYRYLDPEGRSYKLSHLPSGLYLVQTGNEGGDYEYGFVNFVAGGGFTVLVEDSAGQWPGLNARLAEFGLRFRRDGESVTLRGRPDRLRAFFASHDRSLLRETSRCTPRR